MEPGALGPEAKQVLCSKEEGESNAGVTDDVSHAVCVDRSVD